MSWTLSENQMARSNEVFFNVSMRHVSACTGHRGKQEKRTVAVVGLENRELCRGSIDPALSGFENHSGRRARTFREANHSTSRCNGEVSHFCFALCTLPPGVSFQARKYCQDHAVLRPLITKTVDSK